MINSTLPNTNEEMVKLEKSNIASPITNDPLYAESLEWIKNHAYTVNVESMENFIRNINSYFIRKYPDAELPEDMKTL